MDSSGEMLLVSGLGLQFSFPPPIAAFFLAVKRIRQWAWGGKELAFPEQALTEHRCSIRGQGGLACVYSAPTFLTCSSQPLRLLVECSFWEGEPAASSVSECPTMGAALHQ